MQTAILLLALLAAEPLPAGDHIREIQFDGLQRSFVIHVPPKFPRPAPLVMAIHGAMMDAETMAGFTGLSKKADAAGFVVVYPNGTGPAGLFLTWNAGGLRPSLAKTRPDDVGFLIRVLDETAKELPIDSHRVYATGMSNGAMMCYRLAAERADRIAAIAPVAGTMAIDNPKPKRPVPVIHFHGTHDGLVRFTGPDERVKKFMSYHSVDETIRAWIALDGCPLQPAVDALPDIDHDGLCVTRKVYGPGKDGAEVVLYVIDGGGHTWPGRKPGLGPIVRTILGKSTEDISANDLIWEFFQKYRLP